MPRKKKSPREMTNDEIAKAVFPKKVIEEVKKLTEEQGKEAANNSSQE